MKFLLLISVVCFAVALAAPADKQKRDILPGDPRYGTDHHHHHHHEHENEVPQSSYGPPSYKASQPISSDYFAPSDATKSSAIFQVPSTSYGIPDFTQLFNNNYLGPAVEDKQSELIKTVHNFEHQIPSVEAPISSYSSVKQDEHVHIPQISYGSPDEKTTIQQSSFEKVHVEKTVIPEVHHEVQQVQQQQPAVVQKHVEIASVPQVKSQLPVQTQGVVQHSSVPSFTSYPSYTSYSSIPVRTVDHHVHVQVPQPYPVPVTKQVTYPVPVPHTVEVPKPYYVRVPQPVQVTVNRPYPVDVPRPVPYPVPQYIRTSVPVIQQHHVNIDTSKASNPIQGFFDNTQSTFQTVLDTLSFQNPLQSFQYPFNNFELPSLPSLSSLPSLPTLPSFPPQQTQQIAVPASNFDVSAPTTSSDSITIDNPTVKTETIVTKTAVAQPAIAAHHSETITQTQSVAKDTTPCAGCSISASSTSKKEYVQPTDANGGYVY